MKKKVLSIALVLAMLLSLFPAVVSAETTVGLVDSAIRDYWTVEDSSKEYNYPVNENGKEDYTSKNLRPGYGIVVLNDETNYVCDEGCNRIKYQSTVYQPQDYQVLSVVENSNPDAVEVKAGRSGGRLYIHFYYKGEGTSEVAIKYTVGKSANWNNGPGYSELFLGKTGYLYYKVTANHVHIDKDGDGFCDGCGNNEYCLHEKDSEGYCTVENCAHDATCCPKKNVHKDEDGDGFCDNCDDKHCMHEKDEEGYCIVEDCEHDDTCCPKKVEFPYEELDLQWLRDLNMTVQFVCEKNSHHNDLFALYDNRSAGVTIGDPVKNDGADSLYPASKYPWMCEVTLDVDYWFPLYEEMGNHCNIAHCLADPDEEVSYIFYFKNNGYWYRSSFNTIDIAITHK